MFSHVQHTTAYSLMEILSNGVYTGTGVKTIIDYLGGPTSRRHFGLTISLSTAMKCFIMICLNTGRAYHEKMVHKFCNYPQVN